MAARSSFVTLAILLALIATVVSVLPLIAGLNTRILRDWYYLRLNTSTLVTASESPYAALINAIAGKLGLKGFYTTGLWNYASGNATATTFGAISFVSPSNASYWFNPVAIVEADVPAAASFVIPQSVMNDLNVVRIAQTAWKAIMVVGCIFSFLSVLVCIGGYKSRMGSCCATIVTFIAALMLVVAAVLGQVFGLIVRNTINELDNVGLVANLGQKFFVFLWISAGASLLAFILTFMTICCCRPDRHSYKTYEDDRS